VKSSEHFLVFSLVSTCSRHLPVTSAIIIPGIASFSQRSRLQKLLDQLIYDLTASENIGRGEHAGGKRDIAPKGSSMSHHLTVGVVLICFNFDHFESYLNMCEVEKKEIQHGDKQIEEHEEQRSACLKTKSKETLITRSTTKPTRMPGVL
jgi:hypothetical protein